MKRDLSCTAHQRIPDDGDQGPALTAMTLLIMIAVLFGLLFSVIRAEAEETAPQADETRMPPADFKPPIAKKVELPPMVDEERAKEIADQWGVELISLNLTAGGYMIDFRFRVLDVAKANVFFDQRIKPYLLVEKSHAKLPVPMAAKVGAFRPTNRGKNIKPDKNYYIVFGNPDAHVKSGETITMVFGDFKAEHLMVR